ncbi:MAG: TonB-dependent receptor [Gammaproteobacteria bacterium]
MRSLGKGESVQEEMGVLNMRKMGSIGLAAGFTIGAIASAMSLPAIAASERSAVLEEVVVTARKQEESAQDVPIAITALTQELENSSIRNLQDLNGYSPNLVFENNGSRGGGGANINIRGISPTRSDDNSFDAPVAVVIDGIYLGTLAGQVLENFDLERVEILRGPQGTLFGKNTVGGVVNVIRSRPTGEFGGKFKLTGGEDGQQEARFVLNTALSDNVALKVFGTKIDYDGFMTNITTGNGVAEKDYSNVGATLLIESGDNFEALLTIEGFSDTGTLDAFHTNYNTPAGVIPAPPAGSPENDYSGGFLTCTIFGTCRNSLDRPSFSENDKDNNYSLDTEAATLNMTYDINENLTLVSVTGYRQQNEYRIYDFDASAAPMITIERFNDYDQMSQELRLDGAFERLKFTAGLYYFNNEFEQDWITGDQFWGILFGGLLRAPSLGAPGVLTEEGIPALAGVDGLTGCFIGVFAPTSCDTGLTEAPAPGEVITQILYETQETSSVAAYFQGDYNLTDDLTLTAGLRGTRETKDFIAGQAYLSNVARHRERNFPSYADLSQEWTELSPKIGLTYQVNDDAIAFISYSEGFHSGGFFGVNQNIRDFERDQYDPEYAGNWEIGYKSQLLENRMRFNVTYFRNDFEDKQESFVALDPDTKTVATIFDNAASVIYQGIEVEVQYVFNEYLRGFLNYGRLDADYDEFETDINPNDAETIIQDASFLNPRNAPEFTLGVGGTLSVPMGDGDLETFFKYTRIAEVDANLLNLTQSKIAERDDVSASIGYYTEKWALVAFGKNLTDERYEVFFPIATLFAAGSVNRPRTVGVELSYQF